MFVCVCARVCVPRVNSLDISSIVLHEVLTCFFICANRAGHVTYDPQFSVHLSLLQSTASEPLTVHVMCIVQYM